MLTPVRARTMKALLAANVAYALEREDIALSLRAELTRLLGDSG
jgi:hypothetical protein